MGSASLLLHFAAVNCAKSFLGFVPWNYYLQMDPNNSCQVVNFHVLGANSSFLLILLAVLDDFFKAAGLLAVIYVIYAGAKYILSQGSPDETAKARTGVINALVGLAIAMVAIATVSFIGAQVGNYRGGQIGHLDLGSLPNPAGAEGSSLIQTALSITFGILGAVSFLVIVIAGLQYILSQGDAQTVSKAKNTIIYALVGLVLAIVAQSVVSFAVNFHP